MADINKAVDRLSEAVGALIETSINAQGDGGDAEARIAELIAERDRLRAEVGELRELREEDAQLRAQAAEAVKDALHDLRGLVATQ